MPRFMIDRFIMYCSPVTIYTARRDGTFVARCYSIPDFVVEGDTFDETVASATQSVFDSELIAESDLHTSYMIRFTYTPK